MENKTFNIDPSKHHTEEPKFYIGIDTYDKGANSYCLTREVNGVVEIINIKTIRDEKQFQEEIENIAKYFNCKILEPTEDAKKRIEDLKNLKFGDKLDRTQPHWAFLNKHE